MQQTKTILAKRHVHERGTRLAGEFGRRLSLFHTVDHDRRRPQEPKEVGGVALTCGERADLGDSLECPLDRFGEERLTRCLGSVPNPSEMIGKIRAELMTFAGELTDDAAALAVMLEPAKTDLRDDRAGDERARQGQSAVSAG